jgi:hypothetical protein
MALKAEGIVDGGMHAEEALGGSSRFEPLHLALSSPHRLMRILGAIVLPESLFMRAGQPQTPERRGVGAELVGHQQLRDEALLLEQLAHQPQRRPAIAAALDQHVEDLALVVDSAPAVHPLAGDPDHHLVQVPSVAPARTAPPQTPRDHRSELQNPAPNGFAGDIEPTLGKEILDVSVAEREAEAEPDSMLDDSRRKAVATI